MVDNIVHNKMQECINKMVPFYKSLPEEEPDNNKKCSQNISTTTSSNAVTMESIEQIFQEIFQDNNSKLNVINNNKAPLIEQGHNTNSIPITNFWSHDITSNPCHYSK